MTELLGESQAISNLVTKGKLGPKPCEFPFQAPVFAEPTLDLPYSMDILFHSHEAFGIEEPALVREVLLQCSSMTYLQKSSSSLCL